MLELCFRKVVTLIYSNKHVSCYLTRLLIRFVLSLFNWKLIHLLKYCSCQSKYIYFFQIAMLVELIFSFQVWFLLAEGIV